MSIENYEPHQISNTFKEEFEKRIWQRSDVHQQDVEEMAAVEFEKFLKFLVHLYFQKTGGI